MEITEFTQTDRTEVVRLWTCCSLVTPQNDPDKDIDRKMKKDPDLFLVGKLEKRIVASVMGGYEGHRGWVNYLAVDPDFQKIGYGKQMMNEIEKRLKARGCPKINLQVRETHISAIKFYDAIGFSNDHVISLGKRLDFD